MQDHTLSLKLRLRFRAPEGITEEEARMAAHITLAAILPLAVESSPEEPGIAEILSIGPVIG